ncbi:anthranilate synthase component I family protein [Agromyces salentinus]|uniref:Aminodeoxychorismate synthase n=1 Tax=Agromyces salentinus TaxID=269421 RepID=A0ABN2MR02_9MICO|nr:chorismate-binding protein [Agromyces salentinus]
MPRRVRRRRLDGWSDPHLLFRARFTDAAHVVWLDAGPAAVAGLSILAAAHAGSELITADVATGAISRHRPAASGQAAVADRGTVDDVLAVLGAALAVPLERPGAGSDAVSPDAPLGWFGWFGYEFGARIVGVPAEPTDAPDAAFLWVDRAVVFDHAARSADLVWLEDDDDDDDAVADRGIESIAAWQQGLIDAWAGLPSASEDGAHPDAEEGARSAVDPAPVPEAAPEHRWRHPPESYATLIGACQDAIRRGDAYQLCLTNRIDLDVTPDPATTYLALRASSPSHHGGYLRFGEHALLSASPELFLHVTPGGIVSTKPMKGTRPRHPDGEEDRRLRRELLESEKERAENLMIVDLMRNDLGRIAELGTVEVPSLLAVEEYPHVHQLVSTVRARLRHPLTSLDAVKAAFPAGSMTGAPKHSAMTILHGLEGGPRGVYSGAFGYLAVDGGVDLAMVIRSIVLGPGGASIGTGGGITALSVASEEIEETRVKARALLAVLDAASAQRE